MPKYGQALLANVSIEALAVRCFNSARTASAGHCFNRETAEGVLLALSDQYAHARDRP